MGLILFRRRTTAATFTALYGLIVAQARRPVFYTSFGVPDTMDGRFDMIVLHLFLVIRRLRGAAPVFRALSQGLFDAFCADMDANLRELGVSDTRVPKRMRGFGEAFYGRAAAYDAALGSAGEEELADALRRNVYAGAPPAQGGPQRLASFVRATDEALRAQDPRELAQGRISFPDPAAFTAAAP